MNWTDLLAKLDTASDFLTTTVPAGIRAATAAARKALDAADDVAAFLESRAGTPPAQFAPGQPVPRAELLAIRAKCDTALAVPDGAGAGLFDGGVIKKLIAALIQQLIDGLLSGGALPAAAPAK